MGKNKDSKLDGVTISVKVQPRASRSEITGELDGVIKIRLAAPPVDGAANEELIRFLADLLDISKRQVTIKSGLTSKNKIVHVEGVDGATFNKKMRG